MQQTFLGPRIVVTAFLMLVGAFGLNLAAGQFFTPLHEEYGWSLTTLSLAVSLNMITWGIVQPLAGRLIDRFGPKPVIVTSATLMGISYILSSTIEYTWQLFLYYGVFTALGFAGCGSMANSVLVSRWYIKKRATMLARSSMGMNIGQLVLLPLTGILIAGSGFRTAFLILGIIMLGIIVPAALLFMKSSPAQVNQYPDNDPGSNGTVAQSALLSEALRSSEFWLASFGFVACGYTLYMVTMHLPKFAVDLGGTTALGGQLLGIAAFASAISMWMTGQLTKKHSKKNLLIALYAIRIVAFVWLSLSTNIWQLYAFAVVYGISSFPIIPLVTGMIGERFGANALGSILGSMWLFHQLFAGFGVFLGGYLRTVTGGYQFAFGSGALLLLLGILFTILIKEKTNTNVAVAR